MGFLEPENMRSFVCRSVAGIVLLNLALAGPGRGAEWALGDASQIKLATIDEGRQTLALSNGYLERMSPLDRAVRMKSSSDVSNEQFLRHITAQVQDWDQVDEDQLAKLIPAVVKKLAAWKLPWPETILLVKTTGDEEGGAAYCRGSAIVLPKSIVHGPAARLDDLLLHELFHILSSHNRALRKALYADVGFLPCREIELPGDLKLRKLTNPDAPANNYYTEITVDKTPRLVVPILFSEFDKFDPAKGKSLFDYVTFRLIVVEENGDELRPVLKDGQSELLDPANTPGYFDKIGRNTNYIIHPEEVLADNFVLLINDKKDVPTPSVLAAMRKTLERQVAEMPADREER